MTHNKGKKLAWYIATWSILLLVINATYSMNAPSKAITESISTSQLQGYENYSPKVKNLIEKALILTHQNLTYTYGSANPANGGMDCSGTIYYLLKSIGVSSVPRSSNDMYQWVLKSDKIYAVGAKDINSLEFSRLNPGDLLFWSGTYQAKEKHSITHVMLYLGKNKQNQLLMFGSSDGRTYQNKSMWGVSVFDFKLPKADSSSRFEGYSCIPDLTC